MKIKLLFIYLIAASINATESRFFDSAHLKDIQWFFNNGYIKRGNQEGIKLKRGNPPV